MAKTWPNPKWKGEQSPEATAARKRCHAVFDRLWRSPEGPWTSDYSGWQAKQHRRQQAYDWLAKMLGKGPEASHFSKMSLEELLMIEKKVNHLKAVYRL